jgi:hypothetical protein
MTQEQKDLLLKDLCERLPYFTKVQIENEIVVLDSICDDDGYHFNFIGDDREGVNIENIKPYLFPLSSMTDELWDKEFMGYGITEFTRDSFKYGCETLEFNNDNPHLSSMVRFINQLIKNHFDIYGLIPMGLANDATGLNIY